MTNDINLYDQIKPLLDVEKYRERYRYTDVKAMLEPNYGIVLPRYTLKDVPYVYRASDAPIDIKQYLGTIADNNDPLTSLNSSFAPEPIVIYVPKGQVVEAPIRIENTMSGDQDTMAIRRVLIILEESAQATVFLVDHVKQSKEQTKLHAGNNVNQSEGNPNSLPSEVEREGRGGSSGSLYLNSQVIEAFCKDNSHLSMYEMEETDSNCNRFSNLYVSTGRYARLDHFNITLNNGSTRNGIDVFMKGEGSEVTLNGAVIADGEQHVDNNTVIVHEVPQCQSNELYKYVVDDKAVGAFAGRILVNEGAQQTASQMTNNNMCVSDEARMYTQPMLEIYADDVKCAHGSTVGVMDEAGLFYMQQRGIPLEVAKTLLKYAFISQVIDEMKWTSFRDRLHILVDKRLSKEDRCGTCQICSPKNNNE